MTSFQGVASYNGELNNVDAALQDGRQCMPRVHVEDETWYVLVFKGDSMVELTVTCRTGGFGEAMRAAGYPITDLNMDFIRERI